MLYFCIEGGKMAEKVSVISVGFNNFVARDKIIAITAVNTNPIKRAIRIAQEENRLIDATMGKKVKSAIFINSNQLVLSALTPQTLYLRLIEE
jgi:regulator of extracellular matrix RemA (YlzA/DUF370 family)